MAALAILAISMVGLTAGLLVASRTTGIAAHRTLMLQFAQSRLERLLAETRIKIPTKDYSIPGVACCAKMDAGGTFDPTAAPGTGGWQMDTIDGAPTSSAGDDAMFGPVLIFDSSTNATDNFIAKTISARNAAVTNGVDGAQGCGDSTMAGSGTMCREIHVEPATVNGTHMLRAWVRVVTGASASNSVMLQQDIAQ
jgi:hypothetical protein